MSRFIRMMQMNNVGRRNVNWDGNESRDEEMRDPEEMAKERKVRRTFNIANPRMRDLILLYKARTARKKMLRDFFAYCAFLVNFLVIVFLIRDNIGTTYTTYAALKDAIADEEFLFSDSQIRKTYWDIGQVEEFWQWTRGPLANALTSEPEEYIYSYNKVVGSVRFRQLRMNPTNCTVPDNYAKMAGVCYPPYSARASSHDAYGNASQFTYSTPEETGQVIVWALLGFVTIYDAGGFVEDFRIRGITETSQDYYNYWINKLTYMEESGWIDKDTRAVFVDINTYNPSVGVYSNMKYLVEFSVGGQMIPRQIFSPCKIDLYFKFSDQCRVLLEVLFVLYLLHFMREEFMEGYGLWRTRKRPWAYFMSFWNVIDIFSIVLFVVTIYLYISYVVFTTPDQPLAAGTYVNIERPADDFIMIFNVVSLTILVSFFKSFKFLKMNPRLQLLWMTLSTAAPELVAFMFIFMIIFMGFAAMGYVLFGVQYFGFRDPIISITTCIDFALGNFDYEGLKDINRILGPVYYFLFLFLVVFTLMNMFLAILNDSYSQEREVMKNAQTMHAQIAKGFKKRFEKVHRFIKRKRGKFVPPTDTELLNRFLLAPRGPWKGKLTPQKVKDILGESTPNSYAQIAFDKFVQQKSKFNMPLDDIDLTAPRIYDDDEDTSALSKWKSGMGKMKDLGLSAEEGSGELLKRQLQHLDDNKRLEAKVDILLDRIIKMESSSTPVEEVSPLKSILARVSAAGSEEPSGASKFKMLASKAVESSKTDSQEPMLPPPPPLE